eukprot:scaffold8116_cov97-Isochrysis_galbana.AAC.2
MLMRKRVLTAADVHGKGFSLRTGPIAHHTATLSLWMHDYQSAICRIEGCTRSEITEKRRTGGVHGRKHLIDNGLNHARLR